MQDHEKCSFRSKCSYQGNTQLFGNSSSNSKNSQINVMKVHKSCVVSYNYLKVIDLNLIQAGGGGGANRHPTCFSYDFS